ncbi:hypothetical protein SAMN05216276_101790 [Streptosporangium subroseum]|uniref:Uncharacterized protein n=1 Tax=Streptosporangium subroseum TaxID=106412 RepID=A0A239HQM6_9ACTN|nr:hypothetical protein [Streptosporangium subroseum]SNS83622.1 hypothetical protein SAMN05216276_101790 [Streptosporangium subroseum]
MSESGTQEYPFRNPTALEPPEDVEVPTLDLAVPADTLARREGLLVGGLQQIPGSR